MTEKQNGKMTLIMKGNKTHWRIWENDNGCFDVAFSGLVWHKNERNEAYEHIIKITEWFFQAMGHDVKVLIKLINGEFLSPERI